MRIKSFQVDGFGIFCSTGVDTLGPGVNLFRGDNEAGKSTLLAFLRAILFGFETGQSRLNQYKPQNGGQHGGSVDVQLANGSEYRVQRLPGPAVGRVSVYGPDGTTGDDELLGRLFPGVTKDLFRNVFGFSLSELQEAGTLETSEAKSRIYSYGAGSGRVSAVDIERKLEKETQEIFKPGGQKTVNKAILALDQLHQKIGEIASRTREYDSLHEQLKQADRDREAATKAFDEARVEVRRLEQLGRAWEDWCELLRLSEELDSIAVVSSFPEDGISRLERLKEHIGDLQRTVGAALVELELEQARLAGLAVDERLMQSRDEIRELIQKLAQFDSAVRDLPIREAEAAAARGEISEALRQIGDQWTVERALAFDSSLAARNSCWQMGDSLRDKRKACQDAQNSLRDAERDMAERSTVLADAERSLAGVHAPEGGLPRIEQLEDALRGARTALFRQAESRVRRDNAEQLRMQNERQRAARQAEAKQVASPLRLLGALGCAGLLIGAGMSRSQALVAAAMAILGVAVLVIALLYDGKQRVASRARAEAITADIAELDKAISAASVVIASCEQESKDLNESLRVFSATLGRQITCIEDANAVEGDLRQAREVVARHQGLQERAREKRLDVERAGNRVSEVRLHQTRLDAELASASDAWLRWLRSSGLPADLTPDTALEVFARIDLVREKHLSATSTETRVATIREYIEDFERSAASVLRSCDRTVPSRTGLIAAIVALEAELTSATENLATRKQAEESIARMVGNIATLQDRRQQAEAEWQALLASADAADENEFRALGTASARRSALTSQVLNHRTNLRLICGDADLSEFERQLAETNELSVQDRLRDASARSEEAENEMRSQIELRGRLSQEIESIEKSDELSDALLKQRSLVATLERDAAEWASRVICRSVLARARSRYEREKQPRVIQTASEFVCKMTGDRYQRVFSPLGQQEVQLETDSGDRRAVNQLSRGTAEQLYLAIRFGLIREYGASNEPLPVIMDDILVNFDPTRASAAIEAILELAESSQVVFFTCHPDTETRFLDAGGDVSRFLVRSGNITRIQ